MTPPRLCVDRKIITKDRMYSGPFCSAAIRPRVMAEGMKMAPPKAISPWDRRIWSGPVRAVAVLSIQAPAAIISRAAAWIIGTRSGRISSPQTRPPARLATTTQPNSGAICAVP